MCERCMECKILFMSCVIMVWDWCLLLWLVNKDLSLATTSWRMMSFLGRWACSWTMLRVLRRVMWIVGFVVGEVMVFMRDGMKFLLVRVWYKWGDLEMRLSKVSRTLVWEVDSSRISRMESMVFVLSKWVLIFYGLIVS